MKAWKTVLAVALCLTGLGFLDNALARGGGFGGGRGGGFGGGHFHGGGRGGVFLFGGPGYDYYDGYSYDPYYAPPPVADDDLSVQVQRALRRAGCYQGPVDGVIGPGSRAAIRAYQARKGLRVTGAVDGVLLRSLGL